MTGDHWRVKMAARALLYAPAIVLAVGVLVAIRVLECILPIPRRYE